MSWPFQVFECRFTDDVKVSLPEGKREKLYQLIEEWTQEYHEKFDLLMEQLSELLQGIEITGNATFIPLHPGIMCLREEVYNSPGWLPFYFESEYRDPTLRFVCGDVSYVARLNGICVKNVARGIHLATAETDPKTLDFAPHRLDRGFFRLKPYGYYRWFYSIELSILAENLGGEDAEIQPMDNEDDADERAEFINDVYRFGWTGLEFTPMWKE